MKGLVNSLLNDLGDEGDLDGFKLTLEGVDGSDDGEDEADDAEDPDDAADGGGENCGPEHNSVVTGGCFLSLYENGDKSDGPDEVAKADVDVLGHAEQLVFHEEFSP